MTPAEDQIRAELAWQAASLDFTPSEEAWQAIEERAASGHAAVTPNTVPPNTGPPNTMPPNTAPPNTVPPNIGAARRRPQGWLMMAGVAAAVITVLAGTFTGGIGGRSRPVMSPSALSSGLRPARPAVLPPGVVRIAPPAGQPGIVFYAWSITGQIAAGPSPSPGAPRSQIRTRPGVTVCVSDRAPMVPPGKDDSCAESTFFESRVDQTPNFGFPIAGGDAWVGAATAKVGAVEARYADGQVVRGSIVTVPGTSTRIWELGLPGGQRLGTPLSGVSLVLLDAQGRSLGQGTLSVSLPYAPGGARVLAIQLPQSL